LPVDSRGAAADLVAVLATRLAALRACLLLLAAAAPPAPAAEGDWDGAPVASVSFQGADAVPRSVLEARLGLPPGSRFSSAAFAEGLRALLALPGVAGIEAPRIERRADGLHLMLTLVPRLRVRSVALNGLELVSRSKAAAALKTRAGEVFSAAALDDDRAALLELCHEEGLLFAEVEARARPAAEAPGAVEVEVDVDEGHRVAIRRIDVRGNLEVPRRHLLAAIAHRPRLLFGIISKGHYRPKLFQQDLEALRELYRRRGYLDARVASGGIALSADLRRVDLSIVVEEGPRYVIEAIEVGGGSPSLDRALKFQIRSRPGDPLDGRLIEEDRQRILAFYQREAQRVPRVEVRHLVGEDGGDRRVRVAFDVDEGDSWRAGRVELEGNARTRDRVARGALTIRPGAPFTEIDLRSSLEELRALGIFAGVEARTGLSELPPESGASGELRDVTVTVQETAEGLIEVGGGASSGEGEVFAFRLSHPNLDIRDLPGGERGWVRPFTGGGQKLEVEVYPGTRISEFRALFEEPYVYNSFHALQALGASQIYGWRKFDELHVRGELGLRRLWDDERRWSTRLSWGIHDADISDLDDDVPDDVRELRGHTLLTFPALTAGYSEARGNFFSGPIGLQAWTRLEAPLEELGAELSYLKSQTTVQYGIHLNPLLNRLLAAELLDEEHLESAHALRLSARFGWMDGLDGDETPFFDRFYLGGPRSFRGFDYRDVGPRENGVRLGGDAFWAGSLEYSFPLAFPELRAVALFDFGDIEPHLWDFAAGRIRTAAGGGLEVRLRLLGQNIPINLYWVEALRKERDDRERLWSFSLGLLY
jgi:outer membrane protein insertion porin family